MRHRLFNTLAEISLTLCIVATIAWGFFYLTIADGEDKNSMRLLDWSFIAVTGIVPIIWFSSVLIVKAKMRRRSAANVCLICGYDLRATPQRCPECGTIAKNILI